jgi:hypothetical protein
MAGSVNQNSRFDLGARKVFSIPAPKIVLQQYRPIAAVRGCQALPLHSFTAPSVACCRSAPEPLGVSRQSDDSRSAQR